MVKYYESMRVGINLSKHIPTLTVYVAIILLLVLVPSPIAALSQSSEQPQIAFVLNVEGDQRIYLVNLDGTDFRRLTSTVDEFASETDPNWSPDRTQIFFRTASGDAIYSANSLGNAEPTLILANTTFIGTLRLSPDGQQLAFWTMIDSEIAGIYVLDVDGSSLEEIARFNCHCGFNSMLSWSPNGEQLVFQVNNDSNRIGIVEPETMLFRYLTSENLSAFLPSWSPDSTEIAFISRTDDRYDVYVANSDGSAMQSITDNNLEITFQSIWSPDGQWLAITDSYSLYMVNLNDGSLSEGISLRNYLHSPRSETQVTNIANAHITHIQWLATGSGIIFSASVYGSLDSGELYNEAQLGWIDVSYIQLFSECSEENIFPIITLEGEIRDISVYPDLYSQITP